MKAIIITILIALISILMLSGCKFTNEAPLDSSPESQEQAEYYANIQHKYFYKKRHSLLFLIDVFL